MELAMSSTMTITLSPEVEAALERLAVDRRQDTADLAAEAVADYVQREAITVAAIRDGLADMVAGRLVPREDVMAEAWAIIEAAETKRSDRSRG